MVSKKNWAALPQRYQAALHYASVYAMQDMLASYDAKNAEAIARLVAVRHEALGAAGGDHQGAARGARDRCSTRRPRPTRQFKKILDHWRAFRATQHRWFSIADTRAELAVFRTDPR